MAAHLAPTVSISRPWRWRATSHPCSVSSARGGSSALKRNEPAKVHGAAFGLQAGVGVGKRIRVGSASLGPTDGTPPCILPWRGARPGPEDVLPGPGRRLFPPRKSVTEAYAAPPPRGKANHCTKSPATSSPPSSRSARMPPRRPPRAAQTYWTGPVALATHPAASSSSSSRAAAPAAARRSPVRCTAFPRVPCRDVR